MKDTPRWMPTAEEIERLLIDTSTQRDALALVLRNQKVRMHRPAKPNQRYPFKTVNRTVHYIYFYRSYAAVINSGIVGV